MEQPKQKRKTTKKMRAVPLETTQSVQNARLLPNALDGAVNTEPSLLEDMMLSAVSNRSQEVFRLSRNPETYEITVESDITLQDYQKTTPLEDWSFLEKWAKTMQDKTVVFINPTMEGGGVAMLRPPLVHMLRQLGVNAHWYVMEGQNDPDGPNPFLFTKLMHNILQRKSLPDQHITKQGKLVHQQWNKDNAEVLMAQSPIRTADVVMIDDPQPAPLIPYIKSVNPNVKIVWRNHIDTDGNLMADPTTPQGEVASYILDECGVSEADAAITHPVAAFAHPAMWGKTFFAPATVEPHDDLNRQLTEQEIREGIEFVNNEIKIKNTSLSTEEQLSFIDPNRRRIVLIARFDESKGMDKALALGVRTRQLMREAGVVEGELPQVIIVGNGSVDDPSGIPMYEKMMQVRREQYADDKKDIILMRIRHSYKAVNALMYPSLDYTGPDMPAMVALQTSESEGCETRISDWIRHGIPVVVSNRGGMSLQVIEGESGHVLDFNKPDYDIEGGTKFISKLMMDANAYADMRQSTYKAAERFNNREFTTTANVTRLLRVFHYVLTGTKADKTWKISEMIKD